MLVGAVCLNGIPLAMLIRDPSYLKQTSKQRDDSEALPLVAKEPIEHSHSNTNGYDESEMSPLVSKQFSAASVLLNEHSHLKITGTEETEMSPLVPCEDSKPFEDGRTDTKTIQSHKKCCSLWDKFGLFLLTDWKFVMLLICLSMTNLSHISLHWFIPDRAIEIGFSNHDAAMTITVINVSNILSRLVFGTTSSNNFIRRMVILSVYVFISGLNSIFIFLWTTYWTYMLFSIFYGLLRGLFIIYTLLVIVNIVDKDHVSLGLGLLNTFTGIVFVISIPSFGYLNEVTHSYILTFILYGGLEIFGGLFLVTIPIYCCWKSFKNERYVPLPQ